MPVDFIQERKKQKNLAIALVIMFIIAGFILWFGYFKKAPVAPVVIPTALELKINFEVLENPFFEQSELFEKPPPFEGEKGRNNPFLPY